MSGFNFENLHSNNKLAFLDGFLCGLLVAKLAHQIYTDYQEDREFKKLAELAREERANTTPIQD